MISSIPRLPLVLQLDGNVAGVRLGHGRKSELQSGAARSAFDLGDRDE